MNPRDYLAEYDAKVRARTRALSNLNNADEIRAWFVADGRPLEDDQSPYAAAFGVLQALSHELLCIAARADKATANA